MKKNGKYRFAPIDAVFDKSFNLLKINICAYKKDYEESGFQFKECMILTDNHVIELMVFSKQGVSNKQFMEFVNSLNRL